MTGQKLSQTVVLNKGDSLMERFKEMLKLKNDMQRAINRLEPDKNYEPGNIIILDVHLLTIAMFSVTCEVIYTQPGSQWRAHIGVSETFE